LRAVGVRFAIALFANAINSENSKKIFSEFKLKEKEQFYRF